MFCFFFCNFLLTHIRGIRPENEIQKWRILKKKNEQVEFEQPPIRQLELGDAWLTD